MCEESYVLGFRITRTLKETHRFVSRDFVFFFERFRMINSKPTGTPIEKRRS